MAALQTKTVAIIGGSSGIGFRVAQLAAQEGANLIIVGRNRERLTAARSELSQMGVAVMTHEADVHNADALDALFATLPPFNHLVSMIGDVMGGGFLNAPMETIRHVIESKFFTNVRIGQLAATKLLPGGCLIYTSGTGGRAQDACASYVGNLGINALVEGLAVEMAPNIRVNAVSPTWTVTPFWRDMPAEQLATTRQRFAESIPLGRTATIDELAQAYLFLLHNDFITGQHIAVDGGIMLGS